MGVNSNKRRGREASAELEPGQKNWPETRPDPVAIDPVTRWPDPTRS